jgi:hypothetical protein
MKQQCTTGLHAYRDLNTGPDAVARCDLPVPEPGPHSCRPVKVMAANQ